METIEEGSSRTRIRRLGRSQRGGLQLGPFKIAACSRNVQELQLGDELPVTGTIKHGGKRTVKVQKRPNHSLHPPRSFWSMCLQFKKRMEEMEKALVISVKQAQRPF